jgi:addiction module HigA family antidote
MHNPPHPGTVLREWLPEGITVTDAAAALHVARVTLSKILNGSAGISADMALRLSKWFGTSPEMWLGLQTQYDLWQAENREQPVIEPLRKAA